MKPSTDLHELIHSMSPNEKGYFKKMVGGSDDKGANNYLKLFTEIDKQPDYDEEAIKRKYRKERFVKNLTNTKAYLYKLVLRSLRIYQEAENPLLEVKNLETEARILHSRGLFKQASKRINKADELAQYIEAYDHLPSIKRVQRDIVDSDVSSHEKWDELDTILTAQLKAVDTLKLVSEYEQLNRRAVFIFKKYGISRDDSVMEEWKLLLNDPLMNDELAQTTAYTKALYYGMLSIYNYNIRMKREESERCGRLAVEAILSIPKLQQYRPKTVMGVLGNYLFNLDVVHHHKEFEEVVEIMKGLDFQSPYWEAKQFEVLASMRLNKAINMAKYEEGILAFKEIEKGLKQYHKYLGRDTRFMFNYTMAGIAFGAGRYELCQHFVICTEDEEFFRAHMDDRGVLKFLYIISLLERNEFGLAQYRIDSTRKWLQNNKLYFEPEKVLLSMFKKLSKAAGAQNKQEIYRDTQEKLESLLSNNEDGRPTISAHMLILLWIKSKLNGVSLKEMVLLFNEQEAAKLQ